MIETITLGQIAAVIAFVVALYGGIKYLKKEIKEAISEMLKDEFKSVDEKLDNDNKRIKDLEDANKFMYKAISLLLQDDLAILEHLRTNNSTGKMAKEWAQQEEQRLHSDIHSRSQSLTSQQPTMSM